MSSSWENLAKQLGLKGVNCISFNMLYLIINTAEIILASNNSEELVKELAEATTTATVDSNVP